MACGASRRVRLELWQAADAVVSHVAQSNLPDHQRDTGAWSELDRDLSEGLRRHEAGTGGLGVRDWGSTAVQEVQALWGSILGLVIQTADERPARSVTPDLYNVSQVLDAARVQFRRRLRWLTQPSTTTWRRQSSIFARFTKSGRTGSTTSCECRSKRGARAGRKREHFELEVTW